MTLATQGIGFGAYTPTPSGGDLLEAINLFEQQTNRRMDVVNTFRKWGGDSGNFEKAKSSLKQAGSNGRSPLVTWEPLHWDGTQGPYTLEQIVVGAHDDYIKSWADGIRALKFPVYFRFAHEMNGSWYPWSGDPDVYIQAWRHIVDIFDNAGADNAKWVWCVNADDVGGISMEKYWPGQSYVDVMGIDGYNCYVGWRSFSKINGHAYRRLCSLDPGLPIWICETASDEASSDIVGALTSTERHTKAEWIQDLFATSGMERVRVSLWFNQDNPVTYDWRINTSTAALAELKKQLKAAAGWVAPPSPYVSPVPIGLEVAVLGPGSVRVSWRATPSYSRGYRVVYRNTAQGLTTVTSVASPTTSVTLTGLEPWIYAFSVQSYTMVRTSAASSPVVVQVP